MLLGFFITSLTESALHDHSRKYEMNISRKTVLLKKTEFICLARYPAPERECHQRMPKS